MWKGCDPGKAFTAKSPLQGLRLAEGPVHPQLSPGYYQNALPRGSESSYLAVFYLFSSREAFQVRRSLSDSRGTLVGLCHKKPRVRDALPCFASKKCVPSRLPYAWQGGDRTTMPPAGGGGRSSATLCFPAGSRGSQKTTDQTTRVSFMLS